MSCPVTGNRSDEVGFLCCPKGAARGEARRLLLPQAYFTPPTLVVYFLLGFLGDVLDFWWVGVTMASLAISEHWRHWWKPGNAWLSVSSSSIFSAGVCTLLPKGCLCHQGIPDLVSFVSLERFVSNWLTDDTRFPVSLGMGHFGSRYVLCGTSELPMGLSTVVHI